MDCLVAFSKHFRELTHDQITIFFNIIESNQPKSQIIEPEYKPQIVNYFIKKIQNAVEMKQINKYNEQMQTLKNLLFRIQYSNNTLPQTTIICRANQIFSTAICLEILSYFDLNDVLKLQHCSASWYLAACMFMKKLKDLDMDNFKRLYKYSCHDQKVYLWYRFRQLQRIEIGILDDLQLYSKNDATFDCEILPATINYIKAHLYRNEALVAFANIFHKFKFKDNAMTLRIKVHSFYRVDKNIILLYDINKNLLHVQKNKNNNI